MPTVHSQARPSHFESTCTVLSCTSAQWDETYNDTALDPNVLANDVLVMIGPNGCYHQDLVAASDYDYRLDKLLIGMLEYSPTAAGKHYVVFALHIARGNGAEAVVCLAKAWMQSLFLRMMALAIEGTRVKASGSQTPTGPYQMQIESNTRSDQEAFRENLRHREQYRCAITRAFDAARTLELMRNHDIHPPPPYQDMAAVHIIPFALNDNSHEIYGAAKTWDMLRSWTSIDIDRLAGSKFNTPANGVYMSTFEHYPFSRFRFYLNRDAFPDVPNKYAARILAQGYVFNNGQDSADVEFRALPGIEAPDPEFLRIHGAFAQVLHLCGAADFMDRYYRFDEDGGNLPENPTEDIGARLNARLAGLAS